MVGPNETVLCVLVETYNFVGELHNNVWREVRVKNEGSDVGVTVE